MKLELRLYDVSLNTNAFGLRGAVLVARDGTTWHVASGDVSLPQRCRIYTVHDENFAALGWEIPYRLPDAPEPIVREIWGEN